MHKSLLVAALLACIVASPRGADAHGDASIPLYVANGGKDSGTCSDPAAPCASIGFALRQAGKGTQIRVAAGSYPVASTEDLFMLVSGLVQVIGGYDQGFSGASDAATILTGVPAEYRQLLGERGFDIVADRKGIDGPAASEATKLLALHQKLQKGANSGPCIGGMAGTLVCDNVDLLAHIALSDVSALPGEGNDVWGFTDLNSGREYVVAGFRIGTGVFDISDPENPREVGFIDGQNASWRDIKVFQHFDAAAGRFKAYAYVTTDGSSDGLFVIDLSGLPHSIRRLPYTSDFSRAHNAYGTSADFSTGLPLTANPNLIIAGSNQGIGQFRAYSLADPETPVFVVGSSVPNFLPGNGNDTSYMHDAASLLITDARKDTQCVNAGAYCELLLDFNEENIEIWDITDVSDPQRLNPTRQEYANRGYVHSGWWSEDRQFMFVHDELDESRRGLNTTLRVFSIANLTAPMLVGSWTGPTNAIDHNGYVRGNRYYMSNYSRGLTILDISNPLQPVSVGRIDTYPFSEQSGFVGAWGVYPFFPSGTIAVSDMNSGVYLTRDRSRDNAAGGALAFASPSYSVREGQATSIDVTRSGASAGATSVTIEIVHATAAADDYVLASNTLSWADGDSSPRSVSLTGIADGVDEPMESLLLRLVSPTGAAVLGDRNTAHAYVSDPASGPALQFFSATVDATERGFGKAVLIVQRTGNADAAASVDFAVGNATAAASSDYNGPAAGTLNWAAGDGRPQWIEYDIVDDGMAEGDEFFEITLANASGAAIGGNASSRVTIVEETNLAPNAVVASSITVAEGRTVTMDGSQSNDPNGDPLSFAWTQTAGPTVPLAVTVSTATFTAPSVNSDTLLQFQLTVTDPGGLSDSATVSVTVTNTPSSGGGGGAAGLLSVLLACVLAVRRRFIRTDAA
jgi:choice-of-anchor B domain-containing protein